MADTVLSAETETSAHPSTRTGGDTYQVFVHVDADELASRDDEPHGACQLEDGSLLDPEVARRLACDASVVRILERDGRPLSVGRRTRTVPPALRRALHSRDRCCRFPGCTERRFLHAHHIEHWAHGGRTDLSNLVHLCRFHHRLVHEGGYTLERVGTRRRLRFTTPDGRTLPAVPHVQRATGPDLHRRNAESGLDIGPDTCTPNWAGERLDLPLTIDCLVAADSRMRAVDEPPPTPGARPRIPS